MKLTQKELQEKFQKMPVLAAFYGTLRLNQGNYRYFLGEKDNVQHLGTEVVSGYRMYSLGGYPMVFPSSEPGDSIVVDLFSVGDPQAMIGIDRMETGAGYDREVINVNGNDYVMYVGEPEYEAAISANQNKVENGDWLSHRKQAATNVNAKQ